MQANKNCYSGRLKEGKKTNVQRKKERKTEMSLIFWGGEKCKTLLNNLKGAQKCGRSLCRGQITGGGGSRPARLR